MGRRSRMTPGFLHAAAATSFMAALSGCELQELTLAEPPVDVVVVEGFVQVGLPVGGFGGLGSNSIDRISVLLHRTVQGDEGLNEPVPGALVQVTRSDGATFRLRELVEPSPCVSSTPLNGTGTCYVLGPPDLLSEPRLRPGDQLELEVVTLAGEVMRSISAVPGDFSFVGLENEESCTVTADRPFPMVWNESEGAWAYVGETQIYGLADALAPRGIEVEIDPLFLVGLAISSADTVISFPAEFGVFDRFDLDRDVAVALQQGLPPGTRAEVTMSAVDRNYVNWVRGGNFNPSGTVRVPSVTGDGTGFFGTSVTRWVELRAFVDPSTGGQRVCPVVEPSEP